MTKKIILSNILVYSLSHALVDAACAATVYALFAGAIPENLFLFIITYDVLAFSLQPVFGWLTDTLHAPAYSAFGGILLVAVSTLCLPLPLLAVLLAGIGNALFHVGGGASSLHLEAGKATWPGIYVAPGALGLMIGTMIGRGGHFSAWPFLLLLAISASFVLLIPRPKAAAPHEPAGNMQWYEGLILLLLFSIAIRGMVGLSLDLPWKSDPLLLVALTLGVVCGKAVGGILGDRFGWMTIAVSGLVISIPLLSFFSQVPWLAILGIFLFNLSMPITLTCLAEILPGRKGFAFGLTAFALIMGSLPTFTQLRRLTGDRTFIVAAILLSAAALYLALKLFDRYYRLPAPPSKDPVPHVKSDIRRPS